MGFTDLSEFLDDADLTITLGARAYTVPSPDAETGLRLTGMANIAVRVKSGAVVTAEELASIRVDDDDERQFVAVVLGPALDAMIADRIPWTVISRAAQYAFVYFSLGRQAAEQALERGVFKGGAVPPATGATTSTAAKSGRPASAGSSRRAAGASPGARSSKAGSRSR